jgi:hypothetical protein
LALAFISAAWSGLTNRSTRGPPNGGFSPGDAGVIADFAALDDVVVVIASLHFNLKIVVVRIGPICGVR